MVPLFALSDIGLPFPRAATKLIRKARLNGQRKQFRGIHMSTFKALVVSLGVVGVSLVSPAAAVTPQLYAQGMDGIELIAFGPGGDFGTDLYVGTAGTDSTLGGLYTVSPAGLVTRTSFANQNVVSVVFDTQNVLGGGMFYATMGPTFSGAGAIHHVTSDGAGHFTSTVFADFSTLPGAPKPWQLTITSGENGFAPGLYATTGPFSGGRSGSLYRFDSAGTPTVVRSGFTSNESIVFAQGLYGDGMLVSDILGRQILRLSSDGTLSQFAAVGSAPFGPAVMAYGPDGWLYVTDASSGSILRIAPDGTSSIYASLPMPIDAGLQIALGKPLTMAPNGLISGIYTASPEPTGLGSLFFISVVPEPVPAALLACGLFLLARRVRTIET